MTADMLPRQDAEIPFEGMMTDEEKVRLQAEASALLVIAHDLYKQSQRARSLNTKKALEKQAAETRARADSLIAQSLEIDLGDPNYHNDLRLLGVRKHLRETGLEEQRAKTKAARKVGRQIYETTKKEQNTAPDVPDARMRAAHDID